MTHLGGDRYFTVMVSVAAPDKRPPNIAEYISISAIAEARGLDGLILGAPRPGTDTGPSWPETPDNWLDPLTMLGYLAGITTRLGLVAAVSTPGMAPYNLARRLATLDHVSNGRAGWYLIETEALAPRSSEFSEVVTALWDSWEDDARILDKSQGVHVDTDKVHSIGHRAKFFDVAGPTDIPRSPQGHPVLLMSIPCAPEDRIQPDMIVTTSVNAVRHHNHRTQNILQMSVPSDLHRSRTLDYLAALHRERSIDGVLVLAEENRVKALADFCDGLMQIGQRRDTPSTATLRERLALRRPRNRFVSHNDTEHI